MVRDRDQALRKVRLDLNTVAEEIALLGTMPDEETAARIGRTVCAVAGHRWHRNILQFSVSDV